MEQTYYIKDTLIGLFFLALWFSSILIALYLDKKECEQKGVLVQCEWCANRGGMFRPKSCTNCKCKFYH